MDQVSFLWDGWQPLTRILVVGTLAYLWLIFLLRVTGPRNLAKMTTFDFVITVTLGSAFGRVLTAREVAASDAVVAFSLLVMLQWLFASLRRRSARFSRLVDAQPALLYHGEPARRSCAAPASLDGVRPAFGGARTAWDRSTTSKR